MRAPARRRSGPPPEPRHPRQLARSKWTSRHAGLAYRHWVVIEVSGPDVVLQAVLAPATTLRVPWQALRERPRWSPGWT
jgi:tryptophan-rich hypothetical protein